MVSMIALEASLQHWRGVMREGEVVPTLDWQEEVCREVLGRKGEGQEVLRRKGEEQGMLQFCKAVISYCGRHNQEVYYKQCQCAEEAGDLRYFTDLV